VQQLVVSSEGRLEGATVEVVVVRAGHGEVMRSPRLAFGAVSTVDVELREPGVYEASAELFVDDFSCGRKAGANFDVYEAVPLARSLPLSCSRLRVAGPGLVECDGVVVDEAAGTPAAGFERGISTRVVRTDAGVTRWVQQGDRLLLERPGVAAVAVTLQASTSDWVAADDFAYLVPGVLVTAEDGGLQRWAFDTGPHGGDVTQPCAAASRAGRQRLAFCSRPFLVNEALPGGPVTLCEVETEPARATARLIDCVEHPWSLLRIEHGTGLLAVLEGWTVAWRDPFAPEQVVAWLELPPTASYPDDVGREGQQAGASPTWASRELALMGGAQPQLVLAPGDGRVPGETWLRASSELAWRPSDAGTRWTRLDVP
jgi:hypothetical protein